MRADAQRNIAAIVEAATAAFAESGVEATVRDIAARAGVGVGTLYRHFPQRADLLVAVFRNEIDECADAAASLALTRDPGLALAQWFYRYTDLVATKRGFAAVLHSGDPAYDALPEYFDQRMEPALQSLLDAASAAKAVRADLKARELLYAVAAVCMPAGAEESGQARRMVDLLIDGMRFGADS